MDVSDGLDIFRLAVFQTVDAVVQRRMGTEPRVFGIAGNAIAVMVAANRWGCLSSVAAGGQSFSAPPPILQHPHRHGIRVGG